MDFFKKEIQLLMSTLQVFMNVYTHTKFIAN